jgi:hypothetical protein
MAAQIGESSVHSGSTDKLEGAGFTVTSRRALESLLKGVVAQGTFACGGELRESVPSITVSGLGTLSLPLKDDQAAALVPVSKVAPFGKGMATVVDPAVRKARTIPPKNIDIKPSWDSVLHQLVSTVCKSLGVRGCGCQPISNAVV